MIKLAEIKNSVNARKYYVIYPTPGAPRGPAWLAVDPDDGAIASVQGMSDELWIEAATTVESGAGEPLFGRLEVLTPRVLTWVEALGWATAAGLAAVK